MFHIFLPNPKFKQEGEHIEEKGLFLADLVGEGVDGKLVDIQKGKEGKLVIEEDVLFDLGENVDFLEMVVGGEFGVKV